MESRALAYKKVANKVRPVPTTMPEYAKVKRQFPEDPLLSLPILDPHPKEFHPGERLTKERLEEIGVMNNNFLWEEERKLAAAVLLANETAIAWCEGEKGRFRDDYFSPVIFPVIKHIPWCKKNRPTPPAVREKMAELVRKKVEAGVYKPSQSSYRHAIMHVNKKCGNIRIVHNLCPLNKVTVKDAGQPLIIDHYAEQCSGRSIYTTLNLFVGYDQRTLAEESRDYTTFQTPLGTHRLTVLPQGWTGSVQIFHNDVAFILQHETEIAPNFLDDIAVLGPKTRYETADGGYEVLEQNPNVCCFVWEHLMDLNRVLHHLKHAGATVSGLKLGLCQAEVKIVGQLSTYKGRLLDKRMVVKITTWAACESVAEVRGFLGVAGVVRKWIEGFAAMAIPLVELTKKKVEFRWEEKEQQAMDRLKVAVTTCPAIRPIDYTTGLGVILSVDSSVVAVGYILSQMDNVNRRRPARFGSITWNERESRYSQAKLELYGLFCALHSVKIYIIGVTNLTVEVDAKYIKGMINNPDMHPNAAMNRWIAAILMFNFKLVHVPGKKFQGPDGLSRRRRVEEDEEGEKDREEAEEWVEEILMCGIWMASGFIGLNKVWEIKEKVNGERALVMVMGKGGKDEMQGGDDKLLNYELMSEKNGRARRQRKRLRVRIQWDFKAEKRCGTMRR